MDCIGKHGNKKCNEWVKQQFRQNWKWNYWTGDSTHEAKQGKNILKMKGKLRDIIRKKAVGAGEGEHWGNREVAVFTEINEYKFSRSDDRKKSFIHLTNMY